MTWHPLWRFLNEWRRRARSRRDITKLDDCTRGDLDRDLGLSAGQMRVEAQKPFWRA
jgi:uncharacterized protein YjiS (DUF1127 family)